MRTLLATLLLSPALALALTTAEQAELEAFKLQLKAENARLDAEANKNCVGGKIHGLPMIGMTEQVMLQCTWIGQRGALELVNATEVPGAVTRQYQDNSRNLKFVYTRNGVVTGIQR